MLKWVAMPALVQRLATWIAVVVLGLGSVACAHPQQAPLGTLAVSRDVPPPSDAPEQAKTVRVEYALRNDAIDRDFTRSFKDGFARKGLKVDEQIDARAHFDVQDAKIVGTVTYIKTKLGYSILNAELEAIGHYDADVQIDVDVKAKGDSTKATADDWAGTSVGGKPFELARNIMPTNIPVAGPLFLHVHFDLTAACALEVEGQLHATAGVGVSGDVRLAAQYKKDGYVKEDGKKSRFKFDHSAPNFAPAPAPYLTVTGKQQHLKGRCSLQPTAVLLLEHSVGAKLSVEPFLELSADRASARAPWKLAAQAGVSVHAATDIELFGRPLGKPLEFELARVMLTKPGDELRPPPSIPSSRAAAPPAELAMNLLTPVKAVPLASKSRFSLPWKKKH